MPRGLIMLGLTLAIAAFLWRWIDLPNLGRLPGDLVVSHAHVVLYLPITTSLLISLVLTVAVRLFIR
ncbi:MAG: DUF2905 domain-containing protein [Alphaproteobacteria bacterium]|nr:DUF2905 domain-containing protein [Alphaproteobacteria bacterium]